MSSIEEVFLVEEVVVGGRGGRGEEKEEENKEDWRKIEINRLR